MVEKLVNPTFLYQTICVRVVENKCACEHVSITVFLFFSQREKKKKDDHCIFFIYSDTCASGTLRTAIVKYEKLACDEMTWWKGKQQLTRIQD